MSNFIEFGLQVFKIANEIQTKTIRATEIIKRATEEAEGMSEPFKSNFGWLVTKLVDECEKVSDQRNAPTANVIPIPKGATNGDMIKAMFPNTSVCNTYPSFEDDDVFFISIDSAKYVSIEMRVLKSWWNAPYKKGESE